MEGRVLFTGNGKLVMEDLIEHTPDSYRKNTCAPAVRPFCDMIDEFDPHVIVASVYQCMPGRLKMYEALDDEEKYSRIPLIVVGNDEDCNVFAGRIDHKDMKIITRPVDYGRFEKALAEFVEKSIAGKEGRRMKEDQGEAEALAFSRDSGGGKKSILVVDDDVRMLNLIKMYLQDSYEVAVVPNGKLALKFLEKKRADLILLDYLMPEMDGPEVLKRIREESAYPDIPVIFLTGVADREKVVRGLAFNPTGYMLKPVARDELLERLISVFAEEA